MCTGLFCDCLYKCRCLFWRLLPILWCVDLALTLYLIIGLYQANIFACCTFNSVSVDDVCGYDDLGGSSNIEVDQYGYCARIDSGKICDEIGECAEFEGIVPSPPNSNDYSAFGLTLCNEEVLDSVASYNYFWLNSILITKCIGLMFLLLLELRACLKKVKVDEEEAEQTEICAKCGQWGKGCCIKTFILIFKVIFIIFGTCMFLFFCFCSLCVYIYAISHHIVATFAAVYYMRLTGNVWTSTCDSVPSDVRDLCEQTEDICQDGDNYYAVVFDSFELAGPYWVDVASNVLSSIIWIVRIAVMRYAMKSAKSLAPV